MRILLVALVLLTFASCSSKPSAPKAQDPVLPVTLPAKTSPLKCMNIQEGDRHVEFDGRALWLAESGEPQELDLEKGARVRCQKFEIQKDREHAVLIDYAVPAKGDVFEVKRGIADIKTAKWISKPAVIQQRSR